MNANDKAGFAALILRAANKYHREFTEDILETYWQCLESFSLSEIEAAFFTHFRNPNNGHFMPHPNEIIGILCGNSEIQALDAWSKVSYGISCIGAYPTIIFDDCLIHSVIFNMEGWIKLCFQTERELRFRSQEFQKRYQNYLLKRPAQYPNRLIGILEHQSQLQSSPIPTPHLLGNEKAALLTYSEGCEPHQLHARKITLLNSILTSKSTPLIAPSTSSQLTKFNIHQHLFQTTRQENTAELIHSTIQEDTHEK